MVDVHGEWLTGVGLEGGRYVVTLPVRLQDVAGNTIHHAGRYASGYLTDGEFTVSVPESDDPGLSPNDWQITIEVSFNGADTETYVIPTPGGATIELADVVLPQTLGDPEPVLIRGIPGGIAELDEDGDVIDADGNKVGSGGTGVSGGTGDQQWFYGSGPFPGQLGNVKQGTAADPVTDPTGAVFKVSTLQEITEASVEAVLGAGADGVDLLASIQGIAVGTANTQVQPVGVFGAAKTSSIAVGHPGNDACGLYGAGRVTGSGTGTALGAFLIGRRDTATARITAVEVNSWNAAAAATYQSAGLSSATGIWLNSGGTGDSAVGLSISNPFGTQFEVGIGFTSQVTGGKTGGVKTASIRDDSTSDKALWLRGSHATAAILVEQDAGPVMIGTNALLDSTAVLEVRGYGGANPLVRIGGNDSANYGLKVSNGHASTTIVAVGGVDNVLTGTVLGDIAHRFGFDQELHFGRDGGHRGTLRLTDNVAIGQQADSFGGGSGVIFLANADTAPTTDPVGGGILYSDTGALKWRNPAGVTTTVSADSQPLDSDLTAIAAISPSNDDLIQRKAGAWTNRTPAQVKTDLALVKGDVGLGNVDNTSDASKPISTATQTALDAKQALDGDLTTIAGLTATTDNFLQAKGSAWASRTVAQVKTDLGLTGTNSGDQTSIVGITGTKAQFDTAVTDGNILYVGDVTQYTDEMAQDAVGGALTDTATVDFTYNDGANTITADVINDSITYAKIQNVSATNRILGRITTGAGDTEELTAANVRSIINVADGATANDTDANLKARANHTGTQTASTISDFSTAADARITAATGVSVEAHDADLTTIAGLSPSNDDILQRKSGAWTNRTIAQVKTDLALTESDIASLVSDLAGKQPLDSDLTTIAGLTATTDNFLQAKSSAWASRTPAQVKADLYPAEGATTDLGTALSNLGLRTAGTAYPITTSGVVTLTGAVAMNATTLATDTTTGLKIGTGTSQKLGFFNSTPVVQLANYTLTNYSSASRSLNRSSYTLDQLADFVCELYTGLKTLGLCA